MPSQRGPFLARRTPTCEAEESRSVATTTQLGRRPLTYGYRRVSITLPTDVVMPRSTTSGRDHASLGSGDVRRGHLLAVCPLDLWPLTDGIVLRVFHLLRNLAERWRVVLVAPDSTRDVIEDMIPGLERYVPVALKGMWRDLPWIYDSQSLVATVKRELATQPFSRTLLFPGAEHLVFGNTLPPTLIDSIDCRTLTEWRYVAHEQGLRRKAWRLRKLARVAAFERAFGRRAHAVSVVSRDDASVLQRIAGRRSQVHTVPNGVEVLPAPPSSSRSSTPTAIISGVLSYRPNEEAAEFAAREVWPAVRRFIPDAVLNVVGRAPSPRVRSLASCEGINVIGEVPDMRVALSQAWLALAPMKTGSGIKNKVLEAWACGIPVIMTSIAAHGLDLYPGAERGVADEPGRMADRIIELMRDHSRMTTDGIAARRHVESHYSWSFAAQRIDILLRRHLSATTEVPGPIHDEPGIRLDGQQDAHDDVYPSEQAMHQKLR